MEDAEGELALLAQGVPYWVIQLQPLNSLVSTAFYVYGIYIGWDSGLLAGLAYVAIWTVARIAIVATSLAIANAIEGAMAYTVMLLIAGVVQAFTVIAMVTHHQQVWFLPW